MAEAGPSSAAACAPAGGSAEAPLWAGSAAGVESEAAAAVLSVADLQSGHACHFHCLGVQAGQQQTCCGVQEGVEEEKEEVEG